MYFLDQINSISVLVVMTKKGKCKRNQDSRPQKTLKRTKAGTRTRTVQARVVASSPDTPARRTRSSTRKTLGVRRRLIKRKQEVARWSYVGNHEEELNEDQEAKPGDVVESDVQIFDEKNTVVGTRFIFDNYEDGYIFGHLQGPNGRFDVKKTAGHVSVCDAEALEPNSK